jgi:gluconokinase
MRIDFFLAASERQGKPPGVPSDHSLSALTSRATPLECTRMVIVVMGVSGSGKSTIAKLLADKLDRRMIDGDDLHPPDNVAKMRRGVALTDRDREAWLHALIALVADCDAREQDLVLACSALKRDFRHRLAASSPDMRYVYLRISKKEAEKRVAERKGHFMPPSLVASQFEALEEPEDAIVVDATLPADLILDQILAALE